MGVANHNRCHGRVMSTRDRRNRRRYRAGLRCAKRRGIARPVTCIKAPLKPSFAKVRSPSPPWLWESNRVIMKTSPVNRLWGRPEKSWIAPWKRPESIAGRFMSPMRSNISNGSLEGKGVSIKSPMHEKSPSAGHGWKPSCAWSGRAWLWPWGRLRRRLFLGRPFVSPASEAKYCLPNLHRKSWRRCIPLPCSGNRMKHRGSESTKILCPICGPRSRRANVELWLFPETELWTETVLPSVPVRKSWLTAWRQVPPPVWNATMSYQLRGEELPGEGLRRICRKQVELALSVARGEKAVSDTPVHATRKHLKKARAVLRLVRKEIGRGLFKKQDRGLRDVGRLISEIRDAEVRLQTVRELQGIARRQRRHSFDKLEEILMLELENFIAAFAEWQQQAIPILERIHDDIDCWPVDHFGFKQFRRGVQATYKRGRKALAEAKRTQTAESFHLFRKEAKQLWYQLRILRPTNPVVLKNLSDDLGALGNL